MRDHDTIAFNSAMLFALPVSSVLRQHDRTGIDQQHQAFIYNAAGVPIAAGALYPTFGILPSPIIAAAAMALSSVSVVGNALRLRRLRLRRLRL